MVAACARMSVVGTRTSWSIATAPTAMSPCTKVSGPNLCRSSVGFQFKVSDRHDGAYFALQNATGS